jgi:hypothetical protein
VIDDHVSVSAAAEARFFLAPGMSFSARGEGGWAVMVGNLKVLDVVVEVGNALVERVPQAQRFGLTENVDCLIVRLVEGRARTAWSWPEHAHTLP